MPFPYTFPIYWGWPVSAPIVATSIADEYVTREKQSININTAIDRRSTASFTVVDTDGIANYSRGQAVHIMRAGFPPFVKILFAGVIDNVTERRIPVSSVIYHDIRCVDWHYLADKRLAALSWVATEYENYTAGDDGAVAVHSLNWYGQTFTPGTTHNITKIRLLIYRVGNPGTLTVSLKATDAGDDPTGADLAVGTIDANSLTTAAAGEWVDINMTTQVEFDSATVYGIVVRASDGDAANYVGWRKNSAGAYASGEYEASADGGTTWNPDNAQDFMFEEWYYPTAGFIAEDLFDTYLAPEGVTIGEIQLGPDIQEMLVNYQKVSRAFDALAVRANYVWEIDRYKRLFFKVRTTDPAGFAVTSDYIRKHSSSLSHDSSQYRNRQFIRGGTGVTDQQVETFTGDGVRESFSVGYKIHEEPAVTVNAVGQTVGLKGIDTTADCYWAPGSEVVVFDAGSIPGAVAVVITYYGEYEVMIETEDAAEIASRSAAENNTGIVESIADEPYLTVQDEAVAAAESLLDYYAIIGKQFRFATTTWGLEPGQLVTVTHANYGLAAEELLITSVQMNELALGVPQFMITAITGPNMGDWTSFFGSLVRAQDDLTARLSVGEDAILIVMDYESATWEWTEAVTETPFACTPVNSTPCGGTTPVVC